MRIWLVLVALTACATPYQKKGARGGYQDVEIAPATHYITFSGNGYTHLDDAQMFIVRRARELCPEGFDILNSDANLSRSGRVILVDSSGEVTAKDINKPTASATVRCRE